AEETLQAKYHRWKFWRHLALDHAIYLEEMTKLVEQCKMLGNGSRINWPGKLLQEDGYAYVFYRMVRKHAAIRSLLTALAAERYRQKSGQWPDSLENLVPEFLGGAQLVDPFNGNPLRFRRLPDGLVIYSVGADRKDNGGNLSREIDEGVDIGIRLW